MITDVMHLDINLPQQQLWNEEYNPEDPAFDEDEYDPTYPTINRKDTEEKKTEPEVWNPKSMRKTKDVESPVEPSLTENYSLKTMDPSPTEDYSLTSIVTQQMYQPNSQSTQQPHVPSWAYTPERRVSTDSWGSKSQSDSPGQVSIATPDIVGV